MYRCLTTLQKRQLYKNELPTVAAVPMVVHRPGIALNQHWINAFLWQNPFIIRQE